MFFIFERDDKSGQDNDEEEKRISRILDYSQQDEVNEYRQRMGLAPLNCENGKRLAASEKERSQSSISEKEGYNDFNRSYSTQAMLLEVMDVKPSSNQKKNSDHSTVSPDNDFQVQYNAIFSPAKVINPGAHNNRAEPLGISVESFSDSLLLSSSPMITSPT